MLPFLSLLVCCGLLLAPLASAIPHVVVHSDASSASFNVSVDGQPWLSSGDFFFRASGSSFSLQHASLKLSASVDSVPGSDALGSFELTSMTWSGVSDDAAGLTVETSWKAYHSLIAQAGLPPTPRRTVRAVLFTQRYLTAVTGSNTSRQSVISGFPTFALPSTPKPDLGFFQWVGGSVGWQDRRAGKFNGSADIQGGVETGPIVIFDSTATTTALLAPFDSFMDSSLALTPTSSGGDGGLQISFGGLGNFIGVPAGWSMSTLLYFDDVGVTEGLMRWGDVMTRAYGKSRETAANDLINSWLGYSTDRGASYFFGNYENLNYEETMYKVKAYADQEGIPYKYWLTDSRWYEEGRDSGLVTWVPKTEHFPSGFAAVTKNLTWALVAHTRYYSSQTTYAKQNGGTYDFLVQFNSSLPIDSRFWPDIFHQRSDWGLVTLFSDWLMTISDGFDAVNEVAGLGERWLHNMAMASEEAGLTIQYCMALSRHLFQALKYRSVTQIRVSDDGMPNDVFHQWQIGESAIMAFALGVMPFKDTFWTTSVQCANSYYGKNCTEPNVVLESAVASFSAGAVTPGDAVGQSNTSLIFRAITAEGKLLKPTRPMSSLDQWYTAAAFTFAPRPPYQLQSTYTDLHGIRWHYTMAVDNAVELVVGRADLHLELDPTPSSYYAYRAVMGVDDWSTLTRFGEDHAIPASTLPSFTITHLVPVLAPSGVLLIGEEDKWVKVSAQRIVALEVTARGVTARLSGMAGESVTFYYALAGKTTPDVMTATCTLNAVGAGSMSISSEGEWSCGEGASVRVQDGRTVVSSSR